MPKKGKQTKQTTPAKQDNETIRWPKENTYVTREFYGDAQTIVNGKGITLVNGKGITLVKSPLGAPKGFFFSFPKECPPEKVAEVISAMEKLIQEHFQGAEDEAYEAYVVDEELLEIEEQLLARWT